MSTPHTERIAFLEKAITTQELYIDDCKADRAKLTTSFMSASTYAVSQQCIVALRRNEVAIKAAGRKLEKLKKELECLQNPSRKA